MKALQQHQYEKNHNCNNAKDDDAPSEPGTSLGFMAVVGNSVSQQVFPFPHRHDNSLSNGAACGASASSTSLHLPEERRTSSKERGGGLGGGVQQQQQPLPQAVDVSALDELLKHIHEVSASGTGGIKVLTSTSSSSLFSGLSRGHHHHHHAQTRPHHYSHTHQHGSGSGGHYHQQQIPETEPTSYFSSSTQPPDGVKRPEAPAQNSTSSSGSSSSSSSNNPTSSTSIHSSSSSSSTPLQQQIILERPGGGGVSATRSHSQRHSLIKMGSGGGAVPRHHSFNQRGTSHMHFLARMNTNSSSNGPPGVAGVGGGPEESRRPTVAASCLTRQHSYSEGPHVQRAPIVRRTVSLKPKVPPKPLFLPNTATSPPTGEGKYDY